MLEDNEVSNIQELTNLWKNTSLYQLEIVIAMIRAVLECKKD